MWVEYNGRKLSKACFIDRYVKCLNKNCSKNNVFTDNVFFLCIAEIKWKMP